MKESIYKNLDKFIEDSTDGNGYWFPLTELTADIPLAVYDIKKIFNEQPGLLSDLMRKRGIEAVTEVDFEIGPEGVLEGQNIFDLLNEQHEYEVFDLRFWRPRRRETCYAFPQSVEAYYFDESKAWLMYVSHEETVTFAGAEMTAAAEEIIPDEYVFRGWDVRKERKHERKH